MKYLKMLGLAAIAAGALMAFVGAGPASATELTCTNPPGTKVMCTTTTTIHTTTVGGKAVLDSPLGNVECHSTTHSTTVTTGSSTETPSGEGSLSFTECNHTVSVLKNGTLEIHTEGSTANHNGTLTSSGSEVTVEEFGFHCIYTTNNTTIGTVTGSSTTGGKAKLDISATIPRTGGRSGGFCGGSAPWTGTYQVESPEWLDID